MANQVWFGFLDSFDFSFFLVILVGFGGLSRVSWFFLGENKLKKMKF